MKVYSNYLQVLFLLVLVFCVSCGGGSDSALITVGTNPRVSECVNLGTMQNRIISQQEEYYCSDERLIWQYNEESQTVHFLNKDVWLGCDAEFSISIFKDEKTGTYKIVERENPESLMEAICLCFFNFEIDLNNPTTISDTIYVILIRAINEFDYIGHEHLIWEGELVLSNGQGDVLIEENVGYSYYCDRR